MKKSDVFFLGAMIIGAPYYGIIGSIVIQVFLLIAIVYFGIRGD